MNDPITNTNRNDLQAISKKRSLRDARDIRNIHALSTVAQTNTVSALAHKQGNTPKKISSPQKISQRSPLRTQPKNENFPPYSSGTITAQTNRQEPHQNTKQEHFSRKEWEEQERHMLQEARRNSPQVQENENNSEQESFKAFENPQGSIKKINILSYSAPLVVALLKDLLDFTMILALPGIGTILSICFIIAIFLLLFFPKRKYKIALNAHLALLDAFILMGLTPLEGLFFPFNLLPFTVGAVAMIYMADKKFVTKQNMKKSTKKSV